MNRYQDLAQSSEAGGKVEPTWVANIGMDWMALDVTTLQLTKYVYKIQSLSLILKPNLNLSVLVIKP